MCILKKGAAVSVFIETIKQDDVSRLINLLAEMDMSSALEGSVSIQQHRDAHVLASEILVGFDDDPKHKWVGPHWGHISILRDKGYKVGPGDRDSFGWLTGIIHMPHSNTWVMFG